MHGRGITKDKATYWIFVKGKEEPKEASLGSEKINHAINENI